MSTTQAPEAPEILTQVRDVSIAFAGQRPFFSLRPRWTEVVSGIDLEIPAGTTLGVVGESGSGKSTLARMLVSLLAPNARVRGSATTAGVPIVGARRRDLALLRRNTQMVFQDPNGSLNPRMKVATILADVLRTATSLGAQQRASRITELLGLVGLDESAKDRYPHEFSGGQRQRIAIARALAAEPELLVCDEAVSALDVSIQAQVLNLLVELQRKLGLTIFFVAHDIAVVRHMSDRIVVMNLGRVVEIGDADTVYSDPRHPYTRALIDAVPTIDGEMRSERVVGEMVDVDRDEPGCAYRSRCWLYQQLDEPERCRQERPAMLELGNGSQSACHFADRLLDAPPSHEGPPS